jgi:hypothetical protein
LLEATQQGLLSEEINWRSCTGRLFNCFQKNLKHKGLEVMEKSYGSIFYDEEKKLF